MIKYPYLPEGATIGVTAPSSGVEEELHHLLHDARKSLHARGFSLNFGETVWQQDKAKSAPATIRAEEFQRMMASDNIDIIIPPWGGELLVEILEHIDFKKLPNKWVLGYSDTSLLLLAITLNTGIATAHGTNLVDLRGKFSDETTAKWRDVLATKTGQTIVQYSSKKYQKEWQHDNPTDCIFHLTEETNWKSVTKEPVIMEGRLLGGCIDVIRHLIGTPFGNVASFEKNHIKGEQILWFFENCELSTTDLRRTLVQMKLAGWFDHCAGIMFGRSPANRPVENYVVEDVYRALHEELQVPIVYDIDCGHVPPQITLINGAYGKVIVKDGEGKVEQIFKQ